MRQKKPNAVDIEVGQRIKIERTARKISQGELGRKIGVTFQQVQKYESGTNRVGAGRLSQIARVLDMPVSSFFDDAGAPSSGRGISPVRLLAEPGAIRLLEAFARVRGKKLRGAFIALLENAAGKDSADG